MLNLLKVSEVVAYEKNGLQIVFSLETLQDAPTTTVVHVTANNQSQNPFTEFLFQAAVPKVRNVYFYTFIISVEETFKFIEISQIYSCYTFLILVDSGHCLSKQSPGI